MNNSPEHPRATYRFQLTPSFGFRAVERALPYLSKLGITHLYLSPIFEARPGSEHGYDVVDPSRIRNEFGGKDDFLRLSEKAKQNGLGIVLDFVPNHMAAHALNPWWWDALKKGRKSRYWTFFDFQPKPKIVLPVLGQTLADVLRDRELRIRREGEDFVLTYFEHRFPLRKRTYGLIPKNELQETGDETDQVPKKLLDRQYYRLAHWKDSKRYATYRRFFNINELVGLRMEDSEVFHAIHGLLFELYASGHIQGVRIDHVDGLRNPTAYLSSLRKSLDEIADNKSLKAAYIVVEKILHREEKLPPDWPVQGTTGYEFADRLNTLMIDPEGFRSLTRAYEKLSRSAFDAERLVYQSKVRVTYRLFQGELRMLVDHLCHLAGDETGNLRWSREEVEMALVAITASLKPYRTYLEEDKQLSKDETFLREALNRAKQEYPQATKDLWFFFEEVFLGSEYSAPDETSRRAMAEFLYRWQQFTGPVTAKGVEDTAFYNDHRLVSLNEVGGELLVPQDAVAAFHEHNLEIQRHWPATLLASSTHDTKRSEDARARIHVLSELPEEWTRRMARWRKWNRNHRTKVGRVYMPTPALEWLLFQTLVGTWPLTGEPAEDYGSRMKTFMTKAMREGKSMTSWMESAPDMEEAVLNYVDHVLADRERFVRDMQDWVSKVTSYGMLNSLSMLVAKCTSPGVPDFYQGSEMWNLTVVDPDNRRAIHVDHFQENLEGLEELLQKPAPEVLERLCSDWRNGRIKLFLTQRLLEIRKSYPELFSEGRYIPLNVRGNRGSEFVSYARQTDTCMLVVGFPRFFTRLSQEGDFPLGESVWGNTSVVIPGDSLGKAKDLLNPDRSISLGEVGKSQKEMSVGQWLQEFPIGVFLLRHERDEERKKKG